MMTTKILALILIIAFAAITFSCRSDQTPTSPEESEETAEAEGEAILFTLMQNSPNPFNNSTLIRYELKKTLYVTLRLSFPSHTVVLFSGVKTGPDTHYFLYEPAPNLPNGNYRYSLEVNGIYQQRAMTLQR